MSGSTGKTGNSFTSAPRSYWQPLPANGYVTVHIIPEDTRSNAAAMGTQNVSPGGYVREHSHPDQEEIIYVLDGRGTAVIAGERHSMVPGAAFFLGKGVRHSFINEGDKDLRFTWTIVPGHGLHSYFASIGRPRRPGDPAPEPFARPDDVGAIELRSGFAPRE